MPHLALVPFTGFRIREQEMQECGMNLPGLQRRAAAIAELPALGLLTLAGGLPERWTCTYHPAAQVDGKLVEEIASTNPTLVALSALTASVNEAYALASQLRERGVATVMGGLHATACPDEAEQYCEAVVTGPGEAVWQSLLRDAESGALSPRYDAVNNGRHEWFMPRLDLLGAEPPRFTLQTQRGCPLACEFCGASRLLGRFSEKPIQFIRDELRQIESLSARPLLELADDNTFAGERDVDELLDALELSGARWFSEADWRIGERPHLLARLRDAGCRQILVGIESLVFRYPGQGHKVAELRRIINAVQAIQESGVVVNGCFIVGADGETRQSMDRLADFVLKSPLAEVQITIQTPFPGTGLYRRLQREGRLMQDRDWSHYTLFDVTFEPDRMTVAELECGFRDLLQQVYSASASRRREELRRQVWRNGRRVES